MKKRVRESENMFIVVIDVKTSTEKVISVLQNDTVDILLKRCVEAFSLPFGSFNVTYAGLSLDSSAPVGTQLAEGATLTLTRRKFHLSDVPPDVKPEELLNLCATHDNLLPQIMSQDPELGEKLATKDVVKVRTLIMQRALRQHKSIFARDQELKKIWDNPDDEQNQKKIAEMIRLEQIEAARLVAMEQNPESFASVYMLYVPLEVNGVPLKAFVDSGAQMTIMSPQCAERCGILRLMDDRYKGIASGVGTAKILGKIHMVQMKLGRSFFPVSVTILENASMDVLFGLDTLKRYRCCIDLNRGMLVMQDGINGPEEVPFLSEGEIPKSDRSDGGAGFLGGGDSQTGHSTSEASTSASDAKAHEKVPSSGVLPPPDTRTSASFETPTGVTPDAAKINSLVSLGFTHAEVVTALQAVNGDVDAAAELLLVSRS